MLPLVDLVALVHCKPLPGRWRKRAALWNTPVVITADRIIATPIMSHMMYRALDEPIAPPRRTALEHLQHTRAFQKGA